MRKEISTTLVIVTYNWKEALYLSIKSVFKQTILPEQIIIADDGSSKSTELIINRLRKISPVPVMHVWHEDKGFRKCMILNKALSKVKSDYIIQIDGDIILDEKFIQDHLDIAERGYFISGKRAYIPQRESKKLLDDPKRKVNFWKLKDKMQVVRLPHFLNFRRLSNCYDPTGGIKGSNTSYWREDLIRVNGYNESLTGWGYEDKEIAARFINSGILKKRVRYRCLSYHLHHKEASKENLLFHKKILDEMMEKKIRKCKDGISKYFKRTKLESKIRA